MNRKADVLPAELAARNTAGGHVPGEPSMWFFVIGDLFIFVDGIKYNTEATNGAGDGHTFYGEISPRLSLGKISGADLSFGPVKDVLLAATYEFGEDDVDSYLLGPAVDLNIPGFDYFQLNTYLRTTDGRRDGDNVWQITPVWSYTIPVGDSDLVIDGFIDYVYGAHRGMLVHQHQLGNILIRVEGERAFSESYVTVAFRRRDENGALIGMRSYGRYVDVWEKRDGRWAIVHRREVVDWTRSDPAADDWFDRTPAALRGGRKGNDPSDIIGESHGPI